MPNDVTIAEQLDASRAAEAEALRRERLALGAKEATVTQVNGTTTLVSVWRSPHAAEQWT